MKLTPHDNVLVLVPRTASRHDEKPDGFRGGSDKRRGDRRVGLLEQLKRQTQDYERAIHDTESARVTLDTSARGAAAALQRFEQTLSNLRLSLRNHRDACTRIESARVAGEAAALVSAQILGDGPTAIDSHANARASAILGLLGE